MTTLTNLVQDILADGHIDNNEVMALREVIFADGKVDKEEVDILFELKDKAKSYDESFGELFQEAVIAYYLEDGIIDEEEAGDILNLVQGDGVIDELEKRFLVSLKDVRVDNEELKSLIDSI